MPDAPPPGSEKPDDNIEFAIAQALNHIKNQLTEKLTRLENEWLKTYDLERNKKNLEILHSQCEIYRKARERMDSEYAAGLKKITYAKEAFYAMRHSAERALQEANDAVVEQETKRLDEKNQGSKENLLERLDEL